MPAQPPLPVLIVGAGPTGLVLALWLTKFGIPVRIIDKTSGPGTTSRAFAVQAHTLELYEQQPGLAEEAVALGHPVQTLRLSDGHDVITAPIGRFAADETRYPYILVFPQDEHERLLIRHLEARGVYVERETEFVSFTEGDGKTRAVVRTGGVEGAADYSYICGCDGARSLLRHQLNVGFEGGTYQQLFYVADVEASGHAAGPEPFFALKDKDFCLVFPMRHATATRLVGVVPAKVQKPVEEIIYADVAEHVSEITNLTVSKTNWFSVYHVHHRIASAFKTGRIFLLGDAAHIHSPAGGQGMNTGIGDAVNLAWKLKDILQGNAKQELLETYATERQGFARKLIRTTDAGFSAMTSGGLLGFLARKIIMPHIVPRLLRIRFFGSFFFRTLSQIGLSYPDSALTRGDTKAGARLPWVKPLDNHAPLKEAVWQLHVYGTGAEALRQYAASQNLPLHVFPYSVEARRAGLSENAIYLIRPDGYIGFSSRAGDVAALTAYLSKYR